MVAVYTLLNVDRGVPEVWGSTYDIRDLLNATVKLRDGKPITEMNLGLKEKIALKEVLKQIKGTDIEKLLKEYHVIKVMIFNIIWKNTHFEVFFFMNI